MVGIPAIWWRATFCLACLLPLISQAQERNLAVAATPTKDIAATSRVALVIGNSSYRVSPLRNPVNDARAVARVLRELGFDVIARENLNLLQMDEAVREFGRRLERSHAGLFYFAGHGLQIKGRNFLIPIDASFEHEDEVPYRSLDAGQVLDKMDSAKTKVNLMILDACRNNPFHGSFRARRQGLAEMEAPAGTLIAFATAPGALAFDGDGTHGIYTKHLLRQIGERGVPVEQVFKRVRVGVAEETRDRQIPWESSSLREDFQFRPAPTAAAPARRPEAPTTSDAAIELAFWEALKGSSRAEDYSAYLEQFPNGRFVSLARIRQRDLLKVQPTSVPSLPERPPPQVAVAPDDRVTAPDASLPGTGHNAAAFSRDGKLLALAGSDGQLRLFATTSGTERNRQQLGSALTALRFSIDGTHLAVGDVTGTTRLVDIATGKEVWQLAAKGSRVAGLDFSPDGRYLVVASVENDIRLVSARQGTVVREYKMDGLPPRDASFSPDGRYVAVIQGEDKSHLVRVLDIGNGKQQLSVAAAAASFSVNGRYLLAASGGHTPTLFDLATGDAFRRFSRFPLPILAGAYAEDGRFVATVDAEGRGKLLDTRAGDTAGQVIAPRVNARTAAFSSDAMRYVVIDAEGRAALFHFEVKP